MRGATRPPELSQSRRGISIHAPHAGRDFNVIEVQRQRIKISIHAPHAGRDDGLAQLLHDNIISIHAPHAGRDVPYFFKLFKQSAFQSTRPMRGATVLRRQPCADQAAISIHAPHAGRDVFEVLVFHLEVISIHAPHAGRD